MYVQLTKVTSPEHGKEKNTWRMEIHIRMLEQVKICLAQMNRRNHSNQFDQTCKRAYFTLFYQWQYNSIIIEILPKFNKTLNENFNLQLTCQIFFLHTNNKNKSFYVTIFYKKYIKPLIKRIKHTHLVWLN